MSSAAKFQQFLKLRICKTLEASLIDKIIRANAPDKQKILWLRRVAKIGQKCDNITIKTKLVFNVGTAT